MSPDEATLQRVVDVWNVLVHNRGNQPTRVPRGPYRGELAERGTDLDNLPGQTIEVFGAYGYALAPDAVLAADHALAAQDRSDISAGEKLQAIQDALERAAAWLAALPGNVVDVVGGGLVRGVEGALGVPAWVLPVGLIALAVYAARELVPALGARVRRR